MRHILSVSVALLAMILLAGCNTDGLTPQADIPGASTPNSKTTEARPAADQPLQDPQQVDVVADNTSMRPPQNTLEAQAQALERGEQNPAETRTNSQTLGANLYKNNADAPVASNLYSSQTAKGTIRFLPIIGAPVQAVTPLSKELGASARGNGITIKPSGDQSAEHVLKGYLSAFSDGDKVTVVYVWDVLDNAGGRLHRIQGQESVPAKGSDAWTAVPAETMQEIGVNTIAEYLKWKQSQG